MDKLFNYDIYDVFDTQTDEGVNMLLSLFGDLSDSDKQTLSQCLSSSKTTVLELEYIDKDFRSAFSGYYSSKFEQFSNRAKRLHLFDVEISIDDFFSFSGPLTERLAELALEQEVKLLKKEATVGYVGNIVLRPAGSSIVGRCLLDPRKIHRDSDYRIYGCLAEYKADVMGETLGVLAFPTQSQDAEVNVCAHTAIWSLFRYLSQRYANYKEQYPFDIALLNKDLQYGRRFPGRGLYMNQVAAMFGNFGLSAELYQSQDINQAILRSGKGYGWADIYPIVDSDGKELDDTDQVKNVLFHYIHCHIDSGLPPVLGLLNGTTTDDYRGHAVVAVGVKYADFKEAPVVKRNGRVKLNSDFLNGVVVNDDTRSPYYVVSRNLEPMQDKLEYNSGVIDSMVVPLPDKVFMNAETAEVLTTDTINKHPRPAPDDVELVRSLVCTSSRNYKQFRRNSDDAYSRKLVELPLPHFMWITEFSTYSSWVESVDGHSIVEIALDATAGSSDTLPYVWIRFPDRLIINWRRIYGEVVLEVQDEPVSEYFGMSDALSFRRFHGNLRSYCG